MSVVPADWPVQPDPAGNAVCGECGLSWDDTLSTSMTPTPAGRCPFELFHPSTPPPTPEAAVAAAREVAAQVDAALAGYSPADWHDALMLLRDLRSAIERLRRVDANVVTWLYLHGEHGQHQTLDGIAGEFSIGRGRSKERWASEDAVRAYVDRKVEEAGGEYPDPAQVIEWVAEVVPLTASTGLRKTPLRAAGIDLEDYYTSEPGTITVQVPRSD